MHKIEKLMRYHWGLKPHDKCSCPRGGFPKNWTRQLVTTLSTWGTASKVNRRMEKN